MNFDSVFFLACFFPLLLLLHALLRKTAHRNWLLLAAGLIFYSFGSLQGLLLLLAAALVNFLLGLLLQGDKNRKLLCIVGVAGNLAFLTAYKYLDFILGGVLGLPQLPLGLAAPVGISFFTFKGISYLVDVYRDRTRGTKRFFDLLLYISFFPQVMAGPISRFGEFQKQLAGPREDLTAPGLRRFVVGLGKKLILSGTLAKAADGVFALEAMDARLAWLGAVAYMLQIYFDFSGYSDMAIGLGELFGFRTAENFLYPYAADSITDFWRRWHISLSSWFKDYLYIPLGGNRKGKPRAALNKVIVFSLCGLWHGANWTFLLWGFWHGLLSAVESMRLVKPRGWLGRIYTLLTVCVGFVMFRANTVAQGLNVLSAMFTGFTATSAMTVALHSILTGEVLLALAASMVLCLPWKQWAQKKTWYGKVEILAYPACLALFVVCLMRLAAGGFAPFIYFQF